jgi:hypothetical protein
LIDDQWYPIVRWDTAHGYAHKDELNRRGRVRQKIILKNVDHKKALEIADEDIEANWKMYKQSFLKGRRIK